MTLTISENNKTALSKPEIDAMTQVYTDAVADSATAAVAADTALGTAVKGTNWTSGMTLKAHDDAIKALGTAVKGTDWTSDMTLKAHDDAINALQRTGSTVTVGGVVTDAGRDVTLTVKDGAGTAVARYAMIGVKVTKGDGAGNDTGNPAVIDTDLTGLVVKASSGEQLVPSNGAAISNNGNANLIAFTLANGTLTVTPTAKTNNLFIFVHFIMPDGTVEKSAEIKLKEA